MKGLFAFSCYFCDLLSELCSPQEQFIYCNPVNRIFLQQKTQPLDVQGA